jgi:ribosomal protein S3
LIDLNKRILLKQIKGYKITVTGRFKRALRATYLWRKRGGSSIGTITIPIDYEVLLNRTKYGICAIKI